MPNVQYGYERAFIETATPADDPESGEIVTQTREVERVPIRVYTRKWKQTGENIYRLWLCATVTELGAAIASFVPNRGHV